MKKLLLGLALAMVAYFGLSQGAPYPSIFKPANRTETPSERKLLVGSYGIVDAFHPSWNISVVTNASHTLNDTNSIVIVRSPGPDVINHLILPNCTNFIGRHFRIIVVGDRNLAVLTNANSQSVESFTNIVTTAGYAISSNMLCDVFSTGTNWFVTRIAHGNQ